MKFSIRILLYVVGFFILTCCSKKKTETQNQNDTTASPIEYGFEEIIAQDSATINYEIQEDVAISGVGIERSKVKPEILEFLSSLTQSEYGKTIDEGNGFLVITSGPGSHPVFAFAQSATDVLSIDEFILYLSDSSALITTTLYHLVQDKCLILEDLPDGIYLRDFEFKNLSLESYDNDEINEKLQKMMKTLKNKSGSEFIIKFKSKMDDTLFLHLLTYTENGKLYISAVDQRDCGA